MTEQLTMFGAPARLDKLTLIVERDPAVAADGWVATFVGSSRKAHSRPWFEQVTYVGFEQVLLVPHHVREALSASVLTGGYRHPTLSPVDSLKRLYWE